MIIETSPPTASLQGAWIPRNLGTSAEEYRRIMYTRRELILHLDVASVVFLDSLEYIYICPPLQVKMICSGCEVHGHELNLHAG